MPKESEISSDSSPKAESSPALGKLLFSNSSTTQENATACDKDGDQIPYHPFNQLAPYDPMERFMDETPKEQPWNQLHIGLVDGNTVEKMRWEQEKKRETESKL